MTKRRDPYPSETQDRFIVRFPDGMRDRIKKAAEANNRSMNAEIIARLQSSFDEPADFAALARVHDVKSALELASPQDAEEAYQRLARAMGVMPDSQTPDGAHSLHHLERLSRAFEESDLAKKLADATREAARLRDVVDQLASLPSLNRLLETAASEARLEERADSPKAHKKPAAKKGSSHSVDP